MRAVVFTGAGGNEVIQLTERPDPSPSRHQVLVDVQYAGLNPADLAQREGRYPAPAGAPVDVPGIEVSGTIREVGDDVFGFTPGDRVFGLVGGGGLADCVLVDERHLAAVPDPLTDLEAAAAPEALLTAHDAIIMQVALRSGELLVVNGANGGVGTAAVQIGAAVGARVLAVVRNADLADRVAALGADVTDPASMVTEARARGGADVVLELVGAPNIADNLSALSTKGRIVIVGTGAGADASIDLRRLMSKRATIRGTMLRSRPHEEKAAAVQSFAREIVPLLASRRIVPLIDAVYPAADVAAAFDRLAAPGKLGKVLLDFGA